MGITPEACVVVGNETVELYELFDDIASEATECGIGRGGGAAETPLVVTYGAGATVAAEPPK